MTRDPFARDADHRRRLQDEVYRVRGELFEAAEADDATRALAALKDAYRVLEALPDGQLLYTGADGAECFVLPAGARQMMSRFGGTCSECEERFGRGELFYFVPATETTPKETICLRCGGPSNLEQARSGR